MSTGLASGLKGTGYRQVSTMSPQKQDLFSQLLQGVKPGLSSGLSSLSQLASGGTPEMWNQLEAPAMRQFAGLTGNLASRFSGMGSGARQSSGFQNTLGEAGASLAEQLASQRLGLQQQAIRELLGLSKGLLGQEEFAFLPKKKPFWQELMGSAAGGLGQGLGMLPGLFIK